MKEEPEYDELVQALLSLMQQGLATPYNDKGTIRWAVTELLTGEQAKRAMTEQQVLEHYKKGGE